MELNQKERLLLYNQYDILKALKPEDEEYYERAKSIVLYGYKQDYTSLFSGFESEVDVEVSQFVWDILNTYADLQRSFEDLEENERKQIQKSDLIFRGFDGNNESDHYSYLNFLVKQKGDFSFLGVSEDLNSHCNMLYKYKQMIANWKQVKLQNKAPFNLAQIQSIID